MLRWLPLYAVCAVCLVCVALLACQGQSLEELGVAEAQAQEPATTARQECAACVYEECGYAYEECAENEECLRLSKCRSDCKGEHCREVCERKHASGVDDREDLTDCTLALCADECTDE